MSFGGFGSGTSGGFGGFGSNNNTAASTGGSLFGGSTATSGGFGGGGGGFGASNTGGGFGQSKPAFGAPATTSSGGGLFGGGTSTSGGFGGSGGFGSTNNASTGFGASNTSGGGLFGQSKPATGGFGSTNTGGGMFGSGGTGGGFGAATTQPTNAFGSGTSTTNNLFGGGASSAGTGFGAGTTTAGFGNSFGTNNAATGNTTQGTAATPFNPVTEKDGAGASAANVAYQSITMQQPYQNKSFEELRVEDYAQNRRLPQSGSFGGSGGGAFGGFGQNSTSQAGGGMFGSNAGNSGGFGSTASNTGFGGNTNTGFGSSTTGGGLFGQNKPATGGGLFGNNAASSGTSTGAFGATTGGTGGLFGSNTNQQSNPASTGFGSGGFGSTQQNQPAQSGGLFGQSNAAKPAGAFGGFGSSTTNNTAGSTGFGGFGQNNQPAQQNQTTGGLFGSSTPNQNGGSSLFGNNQNKAGSSLFGNNAGASNTGGGLFGNNQQQSNAFGQSGSNTGGGLFGSNNNTQANAGGSLFGNNNQAKPAGSSLFGGSAPNNNSGGGLFGQSQQNTGAGSSLFGNNQQTQQNASGSLFGSQQNKPSGGLFGNSTGGSSLFGNNAQNNTGGSLFGNNQSQGGGSSLFGGNNQSQNQNAGGSMFGSQQAQQQPTQLTASLNSDPYGNAQLFTSLASPSPPVGPLATPLSGAKPAAKPRASLLASVRSGSPMLGASQSLTPRTRPGYGFSYSNYNSPVSGSQSLTPGAVGLLRPATSFGSSLPSKLSKSFSSSNLRGDTGEGHSLLRTPTAGQGSLMLGNGSFGSGSSRKLKINRDLKNQPDFFGEKNTPKALDSAREQEQRPKRVSFDQTAEEHSSRQPAPTDRSRDDASATPNGTPDATKTNGSALDSVPEEVVASQQSASPKSKLNVEPGEYYSIPSIEDLKRMPRPQLEKLDEFVVGRHNVGRIVFGRTGTVNLTQVDLDHIFDDVVVLQPRSATVYSDKLNKPARGDALNVPSTIYLEHTGPRKNMNGGKLSAREVEAHKRRLRKVGDTTFVDYDPDTNVWTFTVDHYTTYGLDDSDDDEDMEEDDMLDLQPKIPDSMKTTSSGLSEPTDDKTQQSFESGVSEVESPDLGSQDDTFEFKLARRSQQSNISVPGGFGADDGMGDLTYDDDDQSEVEMQEPEMQEVENPMSGGLGESELEDPFIEAGAVQPPSPGAIERYHSSLMEEDETDDDEEQGVPGSFRAEPPAPKSILKPTAHAYAYASPEKVAELPWEEQLQRTMSPKKRDRQALRDMQASLIRNQPDVGVESPFKKSLFGQSQFGQSHLATKSAKKGTTAHGASSLGKSQAFTTGMDLINSLWGEPQTKSTAKSTLTEMQYPSKRQRLSDPDTSDASLQNNLKPSFDGQNTLVYALSGPAQQLPSGLRQNIRPLTGRQNDVRFARLTAPEGLDSLVLQHQKDHSDVEEMLRKSNVPQVSAPKDFEFATFAGLAGGGSAKQEQAIWNLCSVLFDPLETIAGDMLAGMHADQIKDYEPWIRLDCFRAFWSKLLEPQVEARIASRKSAEKALLLLSKGNVVDASRTMFEAGDIKLAIMISQLPGSEPSRVMMQKQIEFWCQRKDWSEFSDAHKAIYCILSGEVCTVPGVTGATEDRTAEFCISERFGLDWKEALALEVLYGGSEDLAGAMSAHVDKCAQGKERVKVNTGSTGDNEDTLRSLIRLAASGDVPPESLFDPMTVSGSALNSRLAWQLALMLSATDICTLEDVELDALTLDFATQLEASGDCRKAAWVLMHITEQASRNNAIKALLERNAASLPLPSDDASSIDPWNLCSLGVPHSMIWEAKALYAHAVLREPALQADWLLQTDTDEANSQAHTVLCNIVGPQAVIEQDYKDLASLLAQFVEKSETATFTGWRAGGKVYADFLKVLNLTHKQKQTRAGSDACAELRRGLKELERTGLASKSLEVRVAVLEMKKVLMETQRELGIEITRVEAGAGSKKGSGDLLEGYMKALGVV